MIFLHSLFMAFVSNQSDYLSFFFLFVHKSKKYRNIPEVKIQLLIFSFFFLSKTKCLIINKFDKFTTIRFFCCFSISENYFSFAASTNSVLFIFVFYFFTLLFHCLSVFISFSFISFFFFFSSTPNRCEQCS